MLSHLRFDLYGKRKLFDNYLRVSESRRERERDGVDGGGAGGTCEHMATGRGKSRETK